MLTKEEPKYENWWADHPADDDRFRGLLRIANSIHDAFDLAAGDVEVVDLAEDNSDIHLLTPPLVLARRMREAADRIERRGLRYGTCQWITFTSARGPLLRRNLQADEQHLEDDYRVDRRLTRVAVKRTTKGPDEREVYGAVDLTQQVILRHEVVQGEVVVKPSPRTGAVASS